MKHDELPYVIAVGKYGRRLAGRYVKSYHYKGKKIHQIYVLNAHHHLSAEEYQLEYPNRSKLKFI